MEQDSIHCASGTVTVNCGLVYNKVGLLPVYTMGCQGNEPLDRELIPYISLNNS